MTDYRIEPLEDATFEELAPLMLDAFGDSVDRRYFDWKYRENPAGPARGNIARADNGDIAAFYGMIPEICAFDGATRSVFQSCDTMTHSAHRRKGLFQRLALQTYADAERNDDRFFVYGYGGAASTPGFLKMGWRIEQQLPYLARPAFLSWLGPSQAVRELDKPDAEFELLFKASQPNHPSVLRSSEYLGWRSANPQRRYCFLAADRSFAMFARAAKLLFLVDFWEQDHASGRPVIQSLAWIARRENTKGILTLGTRSSAFYRSLLRHLFVRNPFPSGPASGSIPFISYGPQPFPPDEWSVGPIDHDSY